MNVKFSWLVSLLAIAVLFADTNGLKCYSCGNAPNCDVYSASIVGCPNNTLPAMNYCFVYQFKHYLQRGCANAAYCQIYKNNASVTCNLCGTNKCNAAANIRFSWILVPVIYIMKCAVF